MRTNRLSLEIADRRITADQALDHHAIACEIEETPQAEGTLLRITIHNHGSVPVHIAAVISPLDPPTPASGRRWRIFLDHGSCGWCGVKRLEDLRPSPFLEPIRTVTGLLHRSNLQTTVWDAATGDALLVGFLRQRHGANWIDVKPTTDGIDIDTIEAHQHLDTLLLPGQSRSLDPLLLATGDDPYLLLESYARAVQTHHGRRFDGPPVVGMMTWYGYRTAITEQIVRCNARIIGDLFDGYPQPMQKLMLIDHGWSEDACWGHWEADRGRFSPGMKELADRLADSGLELGLWYTPFCITENAPNYDTLSPMMAVREDGDPQLGKATVWGALPQHSCKSWPVRYFDGTRDDVQEKWRTELQQMREWGATYWKLDFFNLRKSVGDPSSPGDLHARTWETFRRAAGDERHLAPCSCATNMQLGYCDSMRISADIGNAGTWPATMPQYRQGVIPLIALWYKHRTFWINDPDSIQVGKGCSLGEARVRATAAALSGGHLMLSEDLERLDPERLEIIRRLLPPCGKAARPLDLFEAPFPEEYPSLWALTLETALGETTTLASFNLTEKTRTFQIAPSILGLQEDRPFLALEWWQNRWLGIFDRPFDLEVPPGDVAVVHAGYTQDTPSLLSVSHHITGGYIVEDVAFDSSTGTLRGTLATRADLRLVLCGHLPKGWTLSRENSFHGMSGPLGNWQCELVTTSTHTPFAIRFEPPPQ